MNTRDERWLMAILAGTLVIGVGSYWLGRNRLQTRVPLPAPLRLTATPTRAALAPAPTSVADALLSIDKSSLLAHVKHLSQTIGPRLAGTAAENRAADCTQEQFRSFGYTPQRQSFLTKQGDRSSNVLAQLSAPGKRRIVIGAHFDTIRGVPGANDNVSDVAVLLKTARVTAQSLSS